MADNELFIGLISGTSIDGADCALVRFRDNRPQLVASYCHVTPDPLRNAVLQLCEGTGLSLPLLGETDIELGRFFAEGVAELLSRAGIDAAEVRAIGSHGQTVWHQPVGSAAFSLQLGDPNTIAQLTGITTVADFRRRDMAAGGQGAPLAPLLHRQLFQDAATDRAVINIGGIANVTALPASGGCYAFDTGPGNVLMDYWIGKHRQLRYDSEGAWAASGAPSAELLNCLLQEPYLSLPPPKSTGRELFNGPWLERQLATTGLQLAAEDVQATLLQFTLNSLVDGLTSRLKPAEVYLCGGGASNSELVRQLASLLPACKLATTSKLGVDPDWVEAMTFAWLARQNLAGEKMDTRAFTGADEPIILGGIYRA